MTLLGLIIIIAFLAILYEETIGRHKNGGGRVPRKGKK